MHTAFLAFGSNIGDRRAALCRAEALLCEGREIEIVKKSRLYETEAVGGPAGQPPFLNAVVELRTMLSPQQLLSRCRAIEEISGRERIIRWGARTLDLDILSYGAEVIATPYLTIPHPRLHERFFVLTPLAEIAPDWCHPVLEETAAQLWCALSDLSGIRPFKEQW